MTRFPQQLFLSANACYGIFEAPAIIVNNTMKWSINWSLELRYVGLQQTPVHNSDGPGSNIRTFVDNPSLLPHFHPHFPHHSTLRADSPMLLDKTVQVWQKNL